MLDPELLRTFAAIVDTGGFTTAARAVHRTQSAVSLQMRRLEEAVGRPLFAKDGRGVRLTADGERFLPHARRILAAEHEALAAFAEPEAEGHVRIGAHDEYAANLLPRLLPRFRAAYPRIRVELIAAPSDVLARRIEAGELDLAILTEPTAQSGGSTILRTEPAVWVTSPRHDVHREEPVPLALYAPPCAHRAAATQALEQIGRPYWVAYLSASLAGIDAAVREGLAVGVVSAMAVRPGQRILGGDDGFPSLPSFAISLRRRSAKADRARLDRLHAHIVEAFKQPANLAA